MVGGHILTEASVFLTTELGEQLVTEDFVPDSPGGRARWAAEYAYHRRRREEDEDDAWLVLQR